jgi:uncharacterized membrane protein
MVGQYTDTNGAIRGFLLKSGVFTIIDGPGSTYTQPMGINDGDVIVGQYSDALRISHSFIRTP